MKRPKKKKSSVDKRREEEGRSREGVELVRGTGGTEEGKNLRKGEPREGHMAGTTRWCAHLIG